MPATLKTLRNPWLADLFGDTLPVWVTVFDRAIAEGSLGTSDIYTIHDLLDLSGRRDDETAAALLTLLFDALSDGSPCICLDASSAASRLTQLGYPDARRLAQEVVALDEENCPELIGPVSKPLAISRTADSAFVYFQKFLKQEQAVWERLSQRSGMPALPATPEAVRALNEILKPVGSGRGLHPDQRRALALAMLRRFVVISGGPGTGKTSIVGSLLRCLIRTGVLPEEVALAAPTGRAAQRMTDSIRDMRKDPDLAEAEFRAVTLHQLLQFSPTTGRFGRHDENPLPYKVVIVDEASMVGLSLLSQVLLSLPSESRLVLLGDKDQLPSVEVGRWLANLVPDRDPNYGDDVVEGMKKLLPDLPPFAATRDAANGGFEDFVVLRENFRSEQRIRQLAERVNRQEHGAFAAVPAFPAGGWVEGEHKGGCWHLDPGVESKSWRNTLRTWAEHYLRANFREAVNQVRLSTATDVPPESVSQLKELFETIDCSRILAVIREGPWGAAGINATVSSFLRGPGERGVLFPGAPVLILRNDYDRGLHNGDVGIAVPGADGGLRAAFRRGDGFVSYAAHSLPASELAYATTVHKSQGSEFDHVVLVAPPEGGRRLLTRELVYTGLTRAKRSVVLCGPLSVFEFAAANRTERTSGVFRQGL